MFKYLLLVAALTFSSCASLKGNRGMITKSSDKSVVTVTKTALKILKKKGLTIFKVVRHHQGAKRVGLKMPKTVVIIFGNPKLGTPLMLESPSMAIDLPQKMLIREEAGKTLISYNDPAYLKARHGLKDSEVLKKVIGALDKISSAIAAK